MDEVFEGPYGGSAAYGLFRQVQALFESLCFAGDVDGGAGVRLTTALFYSPNGQKISKSGVTPAIDVPASGAHTTARPITGASELKVVTAADAALEAGVQAAIDAANGRVAAR